MALTAAEQYLLELINRARLDPQAEADRYGVSLNSGLSSGTIDGSSKQVLAPNVRLERAAERHGDWMLDANTFSHTGAGGSTPGDRIEDAGYSFSGNWTWRENLAWTGSTGSINLSRAIEQHHEGLYRSAGHRTNTFAEELREIGIAQVTGKFTYQGNTYNASMLTEKFAKSGSDVFITGVSYTDSDNDNFYSIGEGRSGFWVRADGEKDTSGSAGGYAIDVGSDADMNVSVGIGSRTYATLEIDTTNGNAKLDLVKDRSGDWELQMSQSGDLGTGVADARLLGLDDLHLYGSSKSNKIVGNDGNNHLTGYSGYDKLYGGDGQDRLSGGDDNDRLYGGGHRDKLWGGDRYDQLYGGWGNDDLYGGNHADKLKGDSGNDKLYGQHGRDHLFGGSGADQFIFDHGDDVIYDFEDNVDTLRIDRDLVDDGTTISDVLGTARVVNGGDDLRLYFDGGHSITLRDIDDADILANDMTFI